VRKKVSKQRFLKKARKNFCSALRAPGGEPFFKKALLAFFASLHVFRF
jgi:hypothetical protein